LPWSMHEEASDHGSRAHCLRQVEPRWHLTLGDFSPGLGPPFADIAGDQP
jgi:hypothetical protein